MVIFNKNVNKIWESNVFSLYFNCYFIKAHGDDKSSRTYRY